MPGELPPRRRLPSFSGRRDERVEQPDAVYTPRDTVGREIDAHAMVTALRQEITQAHARIGALEDFLDERDRLEQEATRARLREVEDRERARVKAVEDAAIARAAEAASAEVKAREEAKRRSYENRRAVGLALLAFLLGLMATWAKARAGW